ncbi:MAG: hypothetical protein VW362_04460 [Candidatus Nanopelagicales bacterium]
MRRVGIGVIAVLSTIAFGALLGWLWEAWAPRVVLEVAGDGKAYPEGFQPEGYMGDDGVAAILCAVAGLIVGLVVVLLARRVGHTPKITMWTLGIVIVLGIIGAVVMRQVGLALDDVDLPAELAAAQPGDLLTSPLKLRMPGVLVMWPAMSALVVFIVELTDWWQGRRVTAQV